MDKFTRMGLLYDYYGALLSQRQQEVAALYYGDNLSLSELAQEFGISRQGVHDALHSAEKALEHYEDVLGLAAQGIRREEHLRQVEAAAAHIGAVEPDPTAIHTGLQALQEAVGRLRQDG